MKLFNTKIASTAALVVHSTHTTIEMVGHILNETTEKCYGKGYCRRCFS